MLPRLLLIAVVLVAVGVARNWLVEFAVVGAVKSKTGLEFSVRSTSFEPLQGSLLMRDIKVSDPTRAGQELLTIDSLNAVLNTSDFLKKLYRLETVEIHGIHYRYRGDSGETKWFVPKEVWDRFKTRFPDWFAPNFEQDWSLLLSGKPDSQTLERLQQQFDSANYAAGMSEKWSKEFQPLFQKAQTVSQRIERIQAAVALPVLQNANQQNPQQHLESLAAVLQDAGSLETDLRNLVSEAKTLQNTAQNEALALKQLLQSDIEKIKTLKPPKIDQQFVSEILIGPELNEQLAAILAGIESVSAMMNEPTESGTSPWFDINRLPGTDIVFESRKNLTEYCVKRIEFDGDLTFGKVPVYFAGRMFDLASPAANGEQATTIQLCLDSTPLHIATPPSFLEPSLIDLPLDHWTRDLTTPASPLPNDPAEFAMPRIYITAILDQRSEVLRERYIIACPSLELPGRVLGREETLAFAVSPGVSQFYAVVDRAGGNLDGRIRFSQSPIRLTPGLPPQMRGSELDTVLTALARGIDRIDAELTVAGTLENPQIRIQSDLGERFAANLQPVLLSQWNDSRQLMANNLNEKTNDALRQVGNLFTGQLDPLLEQMNLARSQLTGGSTGNANPNMSVQQAIQSLLPGDSKAAPQQLRQQLQQQGTQILNNALQNALQRNQ